MLWNSNGMLESPPEIAVMFTLQYVPGFKFVTFFVVTLLDSERE